MIAMLAAVNRSGPHDPEDLAGSQRREKSNSGPCLVLRFNRLCQYSFSCNTPSFYREMTDDRLVYTHLLGDGDLGKSSDIMREMVYQPWCQNALLGFITANGGFDRQVQMLCDPLGDWIESNTLCLQPLTKSTGTAGKSVRRKAGRPGHWLNLGLKLTTKGRLQQYSRSRGFSQSIDPNDILSETLNGTMVNISFKNCIHMCP